MQAFAAALDALHTARVIDDFEWARWYSEPQQPVVEAVAVPEFRRGRTERVVLAPEIVHRFGVAIYALVVCAEVTEVRFHGEGQAPAPPPLSDELGTRYEPDPDFPVDGGAWRYFPSAPAAATRFSVLSK
jgi:hypothetical protein